MAHKDIYYQNLPHLQPKNGVFAITICLKGSLPKAKIAALQGERDLMSNHLHLIIHKCQRQLFRILQSFKTFTGQRCNNLIYGDKKKGDNRPSFWQKESYDHLVRNRTDFYNQVRYLIHNPVKAQLVSDWEAWNWTYFRPEYRNFDLQYKTWVSLILKVENKKQAVKLKNYLNFAPTLKGVQAIFQFSL